jgi:hypothetical protein
MNLPRTLVALAAASLLAIGIRAVLQPRTGDAAAPELPPDAQAAAERQPASIPVSGDREVERRAVADEHSFVGKPAADPTAPARLTVELVAADGPAQQGEVELRLRSERTGRRASVDPADGCARFEALSPGTYMISLSQLPAGFLAPRDFQPQFLAEPERVSVTLAGEDRTLRLELEPAVHVFGFVRTPDGQLAQSVPVQWSPTNRFSLRATFTSRGDPRAQYFEPLGFDLVEGRYEGDVAGGLWVISLDGQLAGADRAAGARLETPVPQLRQLTPGATAQIDLEFRLAGNCSLRGTIRDEDGQPYGGLVVHAEALHALVEPSTGEKLEWPAGGGLAVSSPVDGSFLLDWLCPGPYSVYVEAQELRSTMDPGVGRGVGAAIQPRRLELLGGIATLEYTIRRPHPVHVTGGVVIDPAWAKEHGVEGLLPMMDLVRPSGREDRPETRAPVAVRAGGFELWVDAGVNDQRLELWLGTEHLVEPLTLSKAAEPAPLSIRIPR